MAFGLVWPARDGAAVPDMSLVQLGRAPLDGVVTALLKRPEGVFRLAELMPDAPGVGAGLLDPLFARWEEYGEAVANAAPVGKAVAEDALGPFLAPLVAPPHLMCIGTNYRDHIAEMGVPIVPEFPYAFLKPLTTIAPPAGPVTLPAMSKMVDWEAELGVVIGRIARRVSREAALAVVAGYLPLNDVSARDWIESRPSLGIDWVMQKGHDAFTPLGPWITLAGGIPDPQALPIECLVNGAVMQRSSTANMLFSVAETIEHLSAIMTLSPGDIIATGTPAGVGFGRTPRLFLKDGDVVTVALGPLGSFATQFVAERAAAALPRGESRAA